MYKNKKIKSFYSRIRSRHPSHDQFRMLFKAPFKSVVRFGSITEEDGVKVEINTPEAVKNSLNKHKMKNCFDLFKVKTADWFTASRDNVGMFVSMKQFLNPELEGDGEDVGINELPYPIVAKHIYGSRGTGNTLIKTEEEFIQWLNNKTLSNYIFEKFHNYNKEYRLHVTEDGCFYTCRKMLKSETPENERWFRNDSNSVWILEENPSFDKPVNWDEIVEHSVKAMMSVGLDFSAIDVRVQSSKNKDGELRENPEFIILETNSAPSMGEITAIKYKEIIPQLLIKKNNLCAD